MMNKRYLGLFAGCLLLLAPTVKAVAAVGDGIQVGPPLLYPVLSVTATHNDNVGLNKDNEDSGWITSIAPSLRVVLPVRRFYLNAEGGLDFVTYSEIDQEDSTNWFAGAAVGGDFPGGLSFKIADKHSRRYLVATQEFGVGEDSAVNLLSATVAYAVRNALRLEFSGSRTASTYDLSLERERVETMVQADLYWKFRPAISGILEAGYAVYEYDSNTAQDNSAAQVALGLSWDVTAKSTGFAKAGMQWKRFDDEDLSRGIEDASYFTLSGGLRHSFTPRTVLVVDIVRASQESDFSDNPYFLRTAAGVSLSQLLTAKLYCRLGLRYVRDDYPNSTSYDNLNDSIPGAESGERADTSIAGNVALGFEATRWLSFELVYAGEARNSNFDTFDYDVNRVSLSAKAAF